MASPAGRGAQVILDGDAQAAARGAVARDLTTNTAAKRALEQAGLVGDGFQPDGASVTGLGAEDEVLGVAGKVDGTAIGFTPAGTGVVARTMQDKLQENLTVNDFGAKGDGISDDTAAFNAYAAYLRGLTGYDQYRLFSLAAGRRYLLNGSVNLTNISALTIAGNGSRLIGAVSGKAVLDALQSPGLIIRDLTLIGQGTPRVGLQIGRALDGLSGSQSISISNVRIDGSWSLAAFYNRAAETSNFFNVFFQNRLNSATAYAAIMDGSATWQIVSDFAATYNPSNPTVADALYPYTATSFNENIFVSGTLKSNYGPAVWMSNFRGHHYLDTYVASGASAPAAVVYFNSGDAPRSLRWKVHAEPGTIPSVLQFSGPATNATLYGLSYENHIEMASGSIFSLAGSLVSATVHDMHVSVHDFFTGATTAFDQPTKWTISGSFFMPGSGRWNATDFRGVGNVSGVVSYFGTLDSSVALPSALNVSSIGNAGSVSSVTLNSINNQYAGGTIPTVTIGSPPAGGSQATAVVGTVGLVSVSMAAVANPGSGYTNNDVVTMSVAGATPIPLRLTVSGGVITNVSGNAVIGSVTPAAMTNTAIAMTGGTGSGLTINGAATVWRILSVTVTGGGGGYLSLPSVTFSAGTNGANTATGSAILTSSLTIGGGAGSITLDSVGTKLGVLGSSGAPTLSLGAFIDSSGVRQNVTGSFIVPANTSLVRLTNTTAAATATITLPTALADGQHIQFISYAGGVTALSFSPAVNGWTNGGALAAFTGLRVRWDATASAWYREQ